MIRVRPVGVLLMDDDKGGDEKLITVPVDSTFPYYSDVDEADDLPPIVKQQIEHFFTHYKDLEPGKWAKLNGWGDRETAERLIMEAIDAGGGRRSKARRVRNDEAGSPAMIRHLLLGSALALSATAALPQAEAAMPMTTPAPKPAPAPRCERIEELNPAPQRGDRGRSDRARPGAGARPASAARAGRCSACRS